MTSPALGIGYYLWRRGRVSFYAGAAYLLLLAVAVRWVPAFASPTVALPAAAPLAVILVRLLILFFLDAPDALARASGYPAHSLLLPATAGALVLWPMLYTATFICVTTSLLTRVLLAPLDVPSFPMAPLVIATCVAAAQAIFWCPSPVPAMRLILVPSVIGAIALGGLVVARAGWPLPVMLATYAAVWAGSFAVARAGLAVARRGGGQRLPALPRWRVRQAFGAAAPFRSPAAAQMWYEWRRTIPVLPLYALGSAVTVAACAAFGLYNARRGNGPVPIAVGNVELTLPLMLSCAFLAGPAFLSTMVSNLGRSEFFARNPALPAFLAVRPMSSVQYVSLKFRALTLTTLGTWAVTLLAMTLTMAMFPPRERLALPALLYKTFGHVGVPVALILAGLACFTWRNGATQLWVTLAGRPALVSAVTFTGIGLLAASAIGGHWLYQHPSALAVVRPLGAHALEAMAALKCAAAVGVGAALARRRLIGQRVMLKAVGAWLMITAALAVATQHFFPSFAHAAALAILLVPLTRLLAAPLVFHWNRHR